ncbi:cobalamin-independent methionine synthase II family protein [Novipirellula artificiosorum]|uniref:5-methyltetrahydropteroyltriglutamate--homocysteine methyltransferase n=1 Tax=Novipirellula artificiosorum TaxID=2528016 RepID=A0A5C6E1W4_9BACT|nr:cobalamin-independent methionine synthase II family protein [Novipirellula artificiosorum]TWU42902.1 5-methyltetrahydropteroyltriglutamate--homocysteine methyltransferase [Novipirellula artificiosorum]
MSQPSLRTTVVGSYPVPEWLMAMPSGQALIDATRVVFKTQEMAGIDVVVDGELYRWDVNHPDTNGMIDYFVKPMDGIREQVTRKDIVEFSQLEGMGFRVAPAGVVEGPIDEGTLNIPRDYARARQCTHHPLKFTLTGPHMLCKTLMDHHYNSRPEMAMALGRALAKQVADIDPEVIQVDEANITGHPEEIGWAADSINLVLDGAVKAKEKGVHLCFGNYGGQSIQKGHWEQLMTLINSLHCDHVVLEFAFRGYDELQYFRDGVDPRMGLGIGVVDVKVNTVETPEQIAQRIETATKRVGDDRIRWVHPDCGFWMNKRSIADRKIANLVRGRDLFLGIDSAAS